MNRYMWSKMNKKTTRYLLILIMVFGILGVMSIRTDAAEKTKTIYVVTSVKTVEEYDYSDIPGYPENNKTTRQTKKQTFSYNKNGLIQKINNNERSTKTVIKYTYDNKLRHKSRMISSGTYNQTVKYKYDKKGRVVSESDLPDGWKYKYNSKGYCTKGAGGAPVIKYKSKGLPSSVSQSGSAWTFKYDKKGNWKSAVNIIATNKTTYSIKNVYSGKKLKKQTIKSTKNSNPDFHSAAVKKVRTFTYKKLKVSAKNASRIQAQQKYILLNGFAMIEGHANSLPLECFY